MTANSNVETSAVAGAATGTRTVRFEIYRYDPDKDARPTMQKLEVRLQPNDKMLLQTSVNQNCYTCHAEKRGPYLWEHAPVRENCLNCHDAHGTINEKMLKVKQPLLCQQCHQTSSHPGPAYPSMSRYAFNQGCMHCHPTIHGSVHPSGNRFFR